MRSFLIFPVSLFLLLGMTGNAFAHDGEVHEENNEEILASIDLGIEDPGLLPDHPFYFVKDISRGIRTLFAFGETKKAELELQFANERAAEALKAAEEKRGEALDRAIAKYQESQRKLAERFQKLEETSQNPNVDKLLENVAKRAVQHEKLFDQLTEDLNPEASVRERIREARVELRRAFVRSAEKDTPEEFEERLERALEESKGGELKHVRSLRILEDLEVAAPEKVREHLDKVREKLADRLTDRVEELVSETGEEELAERFKNIPGDKAHRLTVLKDLRFKVSEENVEDLEKAEEHFLKELGEVLEDSIERAREAIEEASEEIQELERETVAARVSSQAAQTLQDRAREHLNSADQAFEQEQYKRAFGQAISAKSLAKNGLRILEKERDFQEDVQEATDEVQKEVQKARERFEEQKRIIEKRLRNVPDVFCTQEYNPVCGVDGKTYSNRCVAEKQHNVRVEHEGVCQNDAQGDAGSGLEVKRVPVPDSDSVTDREVESE